MVFAQPLIMAAVEDVPSGTDLLIPNWFEFWAGVIAFSIIFLFVWKRALPMLSKTLESRQHAIKGKLEAAETSKQEAESLLQDYRDQLAGSREESNRIIEEARQAGEALKANIIAKAEQEAAELIRRAQEEAASEKSRVAVGLRSEVAALSLDVAERVVGASLDRSSQQALVDRFIDELGGIGN